MINTIAHPVEVYSKFSFKSFKKEWRFRIKAKNGNIIGKSSEGYINKSDCIYNMKSISISLLEHFKN